MTAHINTQNYIQTKNACSYNLDNMRKLSKYVDFSASSQLLGIEKQADDVQALTPTYSLPRPVSNFYRSTCSSGSFGEGEETRENACLNLHQFNEKQQKSMIKDFKRFSKQIDKEEMVDYKSNLVCCFDSINARRRVGSCTYLAFLVYYSFKQRYLKCKYKLTSSILLGNDELSFLAFFIDIRYVLDLSF